MTRKSRTTIPLASSLTKFAAAAVVGAATFAAPAQAGTITFEGANPYDVFGSGDTYYESGYKLTFLAFDQDDVGTGVGSIIDSNDPDSCLNTSCPNNGSLFYGAFNDSIVVLNSATDGALFRIKGIDASFIGAGAVLDNFPIVSGFLRMLGVFTNNTYVTIDIPLYGPGSNGFSFDSWSMSPAVASMNFVQLEMFGYVCSEVTCSAFSSNEAQFAIDNIKLVEVPEPATAAIFGLGLMGLVAGARRRKA